MGISQPKLREWLCRDFSLDELSRLIAILSAIPLEQVFSSAKLQQAMKKNIALPACAYGAHLEVEPVFVLLRLVLLFHKPAGGLSTDAMTNFMVKYRREVHQLAVMDAITGVKLAVGRKSFLAEPPHPVGNFIIHPNIGLTVVTEHAWKRWCERFARASQRLEKNWPRQFITMFLETNETTLPKTVTFKRFLSNGLVPARYFYHHRFQLRFVVGPASAEEPAAKLLTVEIPI